MGHPACTYIQLHNGPIRVTGAALDENVRYPLRFKFTWRVHLMTLVWTWIYSAGSQTGAPTEDAGGQAQALICMAGSPAGAPTGDTPTGDVSVACNGSVSALEQIPVANPASQAQEALT